VSADWWISKPRCAPTIPYFALAHDRADAITVAQLLCHSSGMLDVTDYEWDRPEHDDEALERHVRSLANRTLLFSPGERFAYSNLGYGILGELIAKVSGQSFEDYTGDHIFRPLGMTETTLQATRADPTLLANGHSLDESGTMIRNDVYPYNRRHVPAPLCARTLATWRSGGRRGWMLA
jgi:CubicO group peptidase (beta-lactamase class C family)